jgi:hypothetical protein
LPTADDTDKTTTSGNAPAAAAQHTNDPQFSQEIDMQISLLHRRQNKTVHSPRSNHTQPKSAKRINPGLTQSSANSSMAIAAPGIDTGSRSQFLPNAEHSLNRRIAALRDPNGPGHQELLSRLQSYKDATIRTHRGKNIVLENKKGSMHKKDTNMSSPFNQRQEAWKRKAKASLMRQEAQKEDDEFVRESLKGSNVVPREVSPRASAKQKMRATNNQKQAIINHWLKIIAIHAATKRCAAAHNKNLMYRHLCFMQVEAAMKMQKRWRKITALKRGRRFRSAFLCLRKFMHVALFRVRQEFKNCSERRLKGAGGGRGGGDCCCCCTLVRLPPP